MTAPAGLADLADRAAALVQDGRRAILGIAGVPGAGKSTLAEQLLAELGRRHPPGWVAHVPMDGYHLSDDQLRRLGALSRKGAADTFDAAGYAHLLARLTRSPQEWIYVPGFERTLEQPIAAALVVPPSAALIVTEGNYLLLDQPEWRSAAQEMAQTWFVSTDDEIRLARLVDRHVQFGKEPDAARDWVEAVDEANARMIAATAARADLQIRNTSAGWQAQVPPAR